MEYFRPLPCLCVHNPVVVADLQISLQKLRAECETVFEISIHIMIPDDIILVFYEYLFCEYLDTRNKFNTMVIIILYLNIQ